MNTNDRIPNENVLPTEKEARERIAMVGESDSKGLINLYMATSREDTENFGALRDVLLQAGGLKGKER